MTNRVVRAAAVQLNPVLDSADGTIEKVLHAIADGARQGVQLMVFPETVVPYYPYFSYVTPAVSMGAAHLKLYEHAPTIPGPMSEAIGAAAKQHNMVVVLGVNERDHGTLYNAQVVFDVDGRIALKRRKITPTYHERMVWGMGDGSGLRTVQTAAGNIGALACWEHYNPLARYALMTQHEEIHCSQFPGSLVGPIFSEQMEVTMRHHALESGCFVVNATAWLTDAQKASQAPTPELLKAFNGGCYTAIISPEGKHLAEPLREGEGMVIADLDFALITKRKRMMDSVGHYARPELLSLNVDTRIAAPLANHTVIPAQAGIQAAFGAEAAAVETTAINTHLDSGLRAPTETQAFPREPVRLNDGSLGVASKPITDPRDLEDLAQINALLRQPQGAASSGPQAAYLSAIASLIEKSS